MSENHSIKTCSFPGCSKKKHAKGFCIGHYRQWQRGPRLVALHDNRRPSGTPPRITCDEVPCRKMGTPCHVFRGTKDGCGYGSVELAGRKIGVHKYVWEFENGPVPKGLEIDHQCRVRDCANTDHLRLVTHQVNLTENVVGIAWQLNAAKTHCPQGHLYDEENTCVTKCGSRRCRTCTSEQKQSRRR